MNPERKWDRGLLGHYLHEWSMFCYEVVRFLRLSDSQISQHLLKDTLPFRVLRRMGRYPAGICLPDAVATKERILANLRQIFIQVSDKELACDGSIFGIRLCEQEDGKVALVCVPKDGHYSQSLRRSDDAITQLFRFIIDRDS